MNNYKQFIVDHLDLFQDDDYDLRNVYYQAVSRQFKKETGFYLDFINDSIIKVDGLHFTMDARRYENYEQLMLKYNEYISTLRLTPREIQEKCNLHTLYDWYRIRIKDIMPTAVTLWLGEHGLGSLIYFLNYIMHHEFPEDYSTTNMIMAANEIQYDTIFIKKNIIGLEPLTISVFKNGNIKLYNLTDEHKQEIVRLIKLLRRK